MKSKKIPVKNHSTFSTEFSTEIGCIHADFSLLREVFTRFNFSNVENSYGLKVTGKKEGRTSYPVQRIFMHKLSGKQADMQKSSTAETHSAAEP
ncbi:MAG: hypothetical protein LKF71_02695 [Oscillospiraceae bacterium]|nr:hypothetical protein [Oscillospiraceae bacterium]